MAKLLWDKHLPNIFYATSFIKFIPISCCGSRAGLHSDIVSHASWNRPLLCVQTPVRPPPGSASPRNIPERHWSRKRVRPKEFLSQKLRITITSWCHDLQRQSESLESKYEAGWCWPMLKSELGIRFSIQFGGHAKRDLLILHIVAYQVYYNNHHKIQRLQFQYC